MATNNRADTPSVRAAMDGTRAPHVAILPTMGMGHLIPLLELASRLHLLHGISSTVLLDDSHRDDPLLRSLPPSVSAVLLPPPALDHIPPSAKIETRIILSVSVNLPAIRAALSRLSRDFSLVALVVDLFGSDALCVAREFGAAAYIFYPPNATALSLFLHLPALDAVSACEYRDLPELLRFPGCTPLHGRDLLDPVQDRKNDAYRLLVGNCKKYYEADGIMVNTFEGIEPGPCQALRGLVSGRPPVYPVGPLIRNGPTGAQADPTGCLQWLDRQPVGSVLYVSFGSGGVLSYEQATELAAGLEMSGQRFLWVVRPPRDGPADADFFGIRERGDPLGFLPGGFLERTRGVGLVVPNWAPQTEVLGREATGGFLSHCGWNSTLESLSNGVPMIAWPLYAEQRMNAVVLVEEAKVAIRPARGPGDCDVVGREEVSRVAKALMEGEEGKEVRRRAKAVEVEAKAALAEGGASRAALAEVAGRWKSRAG